LHVGSLEILLSADSAVILKKIIGPLRIPAHLKRVISFTPPCETLMFKIELLRKCDFFLNELSLFRYREKCLTVLYVFV